MRHIYLLLILVYSVHVESKSKNIVLNLDGKWASTPLLLETSEYLAQESNEYFWKYVDSISDLDYQSYGHQHDEAMYRTSLKFASRLLSQGQLNLLKFSLSLRATSPTVQMFNQIGHDRIPQEDCEIYVEINNVITCEKDTVKTFVKMAQDQPKPMLMKSDHHYPGSEHAPVTVILYAQLGTERFSEWHSMLRDMANEVTIDYVLRHFIYKASSKKVRLSGYGVELAIKSTEYKAKDDTKVDEDDQSDGDDVEDEVQGFLFNTLKKKNPDLEDNLKEFRQHLIDSDNEMAPMKVWQLQDLSYQAAEKIFSYPKEEALNMLKEISQNFPVKARSLVKTNVRKEFRKEVKKNQKGLEENNNIYAGDSALFINGLQADLDVYDVFTLLETLRSEAKLMESLHVLGLQGEKMTEMLKIDLKDSDSDYAVDIRDPSIVWINDLEKDRRYAQWPKSIQDLLRPTFPGMLRHVAKNIFHAVFMVNPASKDAMELLKMAEAFYVHSAPVRIGLLFVVDSNPETTGYDDAGVAMWRAFNFIKKEETPVRALSFITDVYQQMTDTEVSSLLVQAVLADLRPDIPPDSIFGQDSVFDQGRQEAAEYLKKTGLGEAPHVLLNGVPMSKKDLEADNFEEAIVTAILKATPDLQRAVYNGFLTDKMDVLEYAMQRSNVMPRLNSRILGGENSFVQFSEDMPNGMVDSPDAFTKMTSNQMAGIISGDMKYMAKRDAASVRSVTNWVVADLETPEGRKIVYEGTRNVKTSNSVRLGIVYNTDASKSDNFITRAVYSAIHALPSAIGRMFITKLMKEENVKDLMDGTKTLEDFEVNGMDMDAFNAVFKKQDSEFIKSYRIYCDRVLGLQAGQRAVIVNGKILGPLSDDEEFLLEDYNLLEKYAIKQYAEQLEEKVKGLGKEEQETSDLIMKVASALLSTKQTESRKDIGFTSTKHSVLTIPPKDPDSPAYDVVAILDPTTRAAQKYTPLIMVLAEVVNVNIRLFLNCREKLSEMPLKSFYRYVLQPEVTFKVTSELASGPAAHFMNMPEKPILTLGMDPPESWLVEAVRTKYDLDNIHLEDIENGVTADFELEYLLLEGHCFDSNSGQPPRGLQFILGTDSKPDIVDTIVMANLGYFQLKANPGAWNLKLRPGRSHDLYKIISHEFTDSPSDSPNVLTVINNFKSKIIKVKVAKKPGMEKEDLLKQEEEPSKGIWDTISSKLGSGDLAGGSQAGTINIFSVASGHLYERFLRIMMLSVLKHTKSKVKFWFLKNYLSPSFKDFIPHYAEKYGFDYELVQYKWPRWLHQQTEKQRMIWGYKILFLDVLFPLNVDKFIFVDADQIVRTDLQELVDFDLEGAPYGYTPFCDSRKEMDGFRFWKQGYWQSHLAGRKYHISALYVVDLKKFRKIAAGDRLRGQYQGLSQDPNSLSNLDQDLPNNMIHQVAIKSLPQEWLFCETWCSSDELKRAKTIDLCNNPLTKEPKLSAAVRIVKEWPDYDNEIKQLWDQIYKTNYSTSDTNKDMEAVDTKDKAHIEL